MTGKNGHDADDDVFYEDIVYKQTRISSKEPLQGRDPSDCFDSSLQGRVLTFSARVQKHLKYYKKCTIPPLHNSARSNNDGETALRTIVVLALFLDSRNTFAVVVSDSVKQYQNAGLKNTCVARLLKDMRVV